MSEFDTSGLGALRAQEEREIDRFRMALDLVEGFAFHAVVADSRDVLQAALVQLPGRFWILRHQPPEDLPAHQAAAQILKELDQTLEDAAGKPVLLDAMAAGHQPAWEIVFRRLNELRNGIERRHPAPLVIAVSPAGEALLGREAPDLWSRRGSGMRLHDHLPKPSATTELLPPPTHWAEFESLCLDLFREIWNDPGAQKNGRQGQIQNGVDIFGVFEGRLMGVQCKLKRSVHSKVTIRELIQDVERAFQFQPPLNTLIFATNGPRDAKVQERARVITAEHRERGLFKVEVWFWEDISLEIYSREALLRRILPIYWPQAARLASPLEEQRVAPTRLPQVAARLVGRTEELAKLDAAWNDPQIHLVMLVAWGGVGKTSLVARWAAQLAARNYEGANYFDWSFYSQGTRETGGASADAFITAALTFFGDAEMARNPTSAWEKGARLAELLAKKRTLLILDGLEPLQHPPGPLKGQLKDPAISALLKGLATTNPGLCLVTTRMNISDLEAFRSTNAPELRLENLSTAAGIELLKTLGVHGSQGELVQLVEDMGGHALTLNLLGQFLSRAHGGDVRRRDRIDLKEADRRTQGGYTFRNIVAYESWLAAGSDEGARQLAVLRLLGLFDRPAGASTLAALRREPIIAGLTELLVELDDEDWNLTVHALVDNGLVSLSSPEEASLDAHPLIREYFARQLREQNPAAWREAHSRLFEHLQECAEYLPETLEGLMPLYQAVVHGCLAGRQQEAFDKVYFKRTLRSQEFYSTRRLGAFGADLGAIACFFELPWHRVSPSLTEATQAWLLNQAAFGLRALGRLAEALEPMRAGLQMGIEQENWKQVAIRANNLSELNLTLGDIGGAVRDAEQAVDFSDRSGDAFARSVNRTTLANALHQAGQRADAATHFRVAEEMQVELQPTYPLLNSLQGFLYCDLLLADAERAAWHVGSDASPTVEGGGNQPPVGASDELAETCREIEQRAAQTLRWATTQNIILNIALDHLTVGRARLYRALLKRLVKASPVFKKSVIEKSESEIEQAVEGLRRAGTVHMLPLGLLTRAWLRSFIGDSDGARADLDEAWEVAERGPMPLYQADIHLHRARLFHDRHALAVGRLLIETHGYGRRLGELEDAEEASEHW